jgi:hypothetical protein
MIGTCACKAIRAGLELAQLVAAADSGLGMHADQFALPQPLHRCVEGIMAVPAVHRDQPGMFDDEVDRFHVRHLGLDHEVHPAATLTGGEQRREPIQVTGVVLGEQSAAALRNVFQPAEGELRSVHRDDRRYDPLSEPVKRLWHGGRSFHPFAVSHVGGCALRLCVRARRFQCPQYFLPPLP